MRAEHDFRWTILDRDRQMIDEAQRQLSAFKEVTLPEYNQRLKQDTAEADKCRSRKTAKK